jgi:hypothetical protein
MGLRIASLVNGTCSVSGDFVNGSVSITLNYVNRFGASAGVHSLTDDEKEDISNHFDNFVNELIAKMEVVNKRLAGGDR